MIQQNLVWKLIANTVNIIVVLFFASDETVWAARFIPIPSLESPAYINTATGVSQDGKVVAGWSDSTDGIRAFKWTAVNGASSLGVGYMPGSMKRVSQATAFSADGKVIVGWTYYFDSNSGSARKMAFIWTAAGGFHGIPASNGYNYIPHALSADGSIIVGEIASGETPRFAVIFHWDDSVEAVLGYAPWSQAQAIGVSRDGLRIVGSGVYAASGSYPRRTFLRDEADGFQFIGDSDGDAYTRATALSADGQLIAGTLNATDSTIFRWRESTGVVDAGTFPGASNTQVLAVDESGDVMVGRAGTVDNWFAIIWDAANGFQRLSDYATQTLSLDLQGWQLTQANAITRRAIVGQGIDPDGLQKAWMILRDVFGDTDNDNDVDGLDLLHYAAEGNFDRMAEFGEEFGQ
jgi:probable HAF family extracellular repeat protein